MGIVIKMLQRRPDEDLALKFATEVLGRHPRSTKRSRPDLPVHSLQPTDNDSLLSIGDYETKKPRLNALLNISPELELLYFSSIYTRKFLDETKLTLKKAVFPEIQPDLTQRGHVRLFSFFVEVMIEQRLHYSTVLHAMQLFDALTAQQYIYRGQILLVGAACLTLSCKLEEIYPIDVQAMTMQANAVFSADELLQMEGKVLQLMNFRVTFPTRLEFAQYYCKLLALSSRQSSLVDYLVGLSMCDYNLNYFPLSQVAAATVHYALQLTKPGFVWSDKHTLITRYGEAQLQEAVVRVRLIHWHVEKYPVPNLVHYFASETRHMVSDINAVAYQHLLFGAETKLPKTEAEFPLPNRSGIVYAYHAPPQLSSASSLS